MCFILKNINNFLSNKNKKQKVSESRMYNTFIGLVFFLKQHVTIKKKIIYFWTWHFSY